MSDENLEIIRASIDAYNRGDWDAALGAASPSFELDMSRSVGPQQGTYNLDQVKGFWAEFADVFESVRIEPEEFIDAGDQVVVPWKMHGQGRGGIEVDARTTWVFTFQSGQVARATMYQDLDSALRETGLGR
jgi:ketosteroid isomerase-like protein